MFKERMFPSESPLDDVQKAQVAWKERQEKVTKAMAEGGNVEAARRETHWITNLVMPKDYLGQKLKSVAGTADFNPKLVKVTTSEGVHVFDPGAPIAALTGCLDEGSSYPLLRMTWTDLVLRQWTAQRQLNELGPIFPSDRFLDRIWSISYRLGNL